MASSYVTGELPRSYAGSGEQRRLIRTFSTRWDAGDATPQQTEAVLLSHFGVAFNATILEVPGAVAKEITHDVDKDNPQFWETTVTYEVNRTSQDDQQRSIANPTDRQPRVSMYWEPIRTPVPDDRDGEIIKNSAGQVPDPRVEVDGMLRGFRIEGDFYPMPTWVWEYADRRGCINDAPFSVRLETGQLINVETGCAAIRNLRTSNLQYENSYPHYNVNFDLLLRDAPVRVRTVEEGWVYDMVDAGMMEIAEIPDDTELPIKLKHILDASGNEVTSPVPLDGAGHPIEDPTTEELYVYYWNVMAARPFAGVLPGCV